jgi:hypothetical protein
MNKLCFLLLACALAACGGSSGGNDTSTDPTTPAPPAPSTPLPADASPCVRNTHALCQKACACTGTGSCVVAYGTVVTEEHDSISDCENFYTYFVCGDPARAKDYVEPACGTALGTAACVATSSKGQAVSFPSACKSP